MVLGKLPVPRRPTNLDYSRARTYCACSGCRRKKREMIDERKKMSKLDIFFLSSIISLFFVPLWETARYRLKYCLKGPLSPKQPASLCHRLLAELRPY